ncbi:hypothetical protein [Roseateles aquatilis]|nr:hypothetical protein [Roseateles aquatilis]
MTKKTCNCCWCPSSSGPWRNGFIFGRPFARAALEIASQLIGSRDVQTGIAIDDPLRHETVMRHIRWWTFLHELGHELFHTRPELVTNIDDKVEQARQACSGIKDRVVLSNVTSIDDARIALRRKGILRAAGDGIDELNSSLRTPGTREEVWCDFFAVEQMTMQAFIRETNPRDLYLALMLAHYSNGLLTQAQRFFDPGVSDADYARSFQAQELATRADLRAMHLGAMLQTIFIGPLGLDAAQCVTQWIGGNYPIMNRFCELESHIGRLLHPQMRSAALASCDAWSATLSEKDRERHFEDLQSELGWGG